MSRQMRLFFILILAFVFLVFSVYLILFSKGYHISLSEKKIYKTGGIYFKVLPKEAEIFLNHQFVKKTDSIFGSLFLQKLKPGRFWVEIKKENYLPWKKEIEVKENEVTEIRHIILFPERINFVLLKNNVLNFWPTKNENEIFLLKKENNLLTISLFDIASEKETILEFIPKIKSNQEIVNIVLLEGNKVFLVMRDNETKTESLFVYEIGGKDRYLKPPLLEENNLFISQQEKKINFNQETIFLLQERLLKRSDFSQEVLMNGVKDFLPSPDRKKIAVFTENEIWIMFPENNFKKVFLARFSKKIEHPHWLNNDYLLFVTEGKIKISETDNQNILNYYSWDKPEVLKIFWQKNAKRMVVLSGKNLFISEKLF